MYGELLSKTWDAMLSEDIRIECNTRMHVIQILAGELDVTEDSVLLIYYNIFDGIPNLLVHYFEGDIELTPEKVEGYVSSVQKGKENSGASYTQLLYVRKELANEEDD